MTNTKQETDAWTEAFLRLSSAAFAQGFGSEPALTYAQCVVESLRKVNLDEGRLSRVLDVLCPYISSRAYPTDTLARSAIDFVGQQDRFLSGKSQKIVQV